jgi:hypothetical protein
MRDALLLQRPRDQPTAAGFEVSVVQSAAVQTRRTIAAKDNWVIKYLKVISKIDVK